MEGIQPDTVAGAQHPEIIQDPEPAPHKRTRCPNPHWLLSLDLCFAGFAEAELGAGVAFHPQVISRNGR
jgi:hypothetical protein